MRHSHNDLRILYRDFAYANHGPFRMAETNPNIGDASAQTYAELLSGPTLDIYVGEEKHHWSLHRNLLVHHSPFFEEGFSGDLKKKQQTLELPEEDPRGFELLVKYLYQGTLAPVADLPDDKKWDYAVSCQKLYVLCEKLQMPSLKNRAIDQYRHGMYEAGLVPDPEEIKPIYEKAAPGTPLRKLMTKIAARQIMDPEQDKDASSYRCCFEGDPEFAVDLVNAIREGAGGSLFPDPTSEETQCTFHEHEDGQTCDNTNGNGSGRKLKKINKGKERRRPAKLEIRQRPATLKAPTPLPVPPIKPARLTKMLKLKPKKPAKASLALMGAVYLIWFFTVYTAFVALIKAYTGGMMMQGYQSVWV
ncbi:MAG: hypothetical protein M1819_005303 [Sarea resinae]|nr:MAG: hypothetical protein M1819_005303 [Sarea resinae]